MLVIVSGMFRTAVRPLWRLGLAGVVAVTVLAASTSSDAAGSLSLTTLQKQIVAGTTTSSAGTVLPSVKNVIKGPAWTFVGNTLVTNACNPRQTPSLIAHPKPCSFGSSKATKTVVLVGASHAGMWMPAFKSMASSDFYQFKAFIYAGCPPLITDFTVAPFSRDGKYVTAEQCATWNQNVADAVNALHPYAVIVSGGSQSMTTQSGVLAEWVSGMTQFINRFTATKKIIIGSTPVLNISTEMAKCVDTNSKNVTTCNTTYNSTSNTDITSLLLARDAQVAAATGARLVSVMPLVCTPTSSSKPIGTCPAVVNHKLVYVDDNHLTAVYVTYVTPVFRSLVNVALKG
jgi:hypothetical protein